LRGSALQDEGLAEAWSEGAALAAGRQDQGHWARRRGMQARHWFEEEVRQGVLAQLTDDPDIAAEMTRLGAEVAAGTTGPSEAASDLLAQLRS